MADGTFTWLGHATCRLTLPDDRVILIDPWLKNNPSCPDACKEVSRCDIIALTHGHFDHTEDVAGLIEKFDPHVVGMVELCDVLGQTSPKGKFAAMNIGGTQIVDGVSFTLTRAYHSSSIPTSNGPAYTGMPCGIVVSVDGLATFYHAGDTDVFSDMQLIAHLHAPNVVALPIGDHFTMGPKGAALAAKYLNAETIIPLHYGTFPLLHGTPDQFRQVLEEPFKSRLIVPKAGDALAWTMNGIRSD